MAGAYSVTHFGHALTLGMVAMTTKVPTGRGLLYCLQFSITCLPNFTTGGGGIAFTAYLDHDVDLGIHQTLKLNQVSG